MIKIKAIFFLCLFLISQASFSLEIHFCHQELTDISLAGKAECVCLETHHEDHNTACHEHKKACQHSNDKDVLEKKDCCSTQLISIDNNAELVTQKNVELLKNTVILPFTFEYIFLSSRAIEILPEIYIPPLFSRDVRVEIQSFQV